MVKVYCEHSAVTPDLRTLQSRGLVELVHFPYDPDSRSRRLKISAVPSEAQWGDLNLTWAEIGNRTWGDFRGSQHLPEILQVIGPANRRDALHIDSAFKSDCQVFVTRDSDILAHRKRLEDLLGIRFFHPDEDKDALLQFIHSAHTP
jgi:hypothetical protein